MENISIGIITDDFDYGKALSTSITQIHKNFLVTLYSGDRVHSITGTEEDVFLIDEKTQGDKIHFERCIFLVDKLSDTSKDSADKENHLWKYGNVRKTVNDIIAIYGKMSGRKLVNINTEDVKIFGFSSAEGGSGCTSVTMACAQELKRFYNKKVMYISLEEIESTENYMEPFQEGKGINEYLYYTLAKGKGLEKGFPAGYLESFLIFDDYGVEAFSPFLGRNLLKDLSLDEMKVFLTGLIDNGRYDVILLDFGNGLSKALIDSYDFCDRICLVREGERETYKERKYFDYLKQTKGIEFTEGMIKVANKYVEAEAEEEVEEESQNEDLIRIPYDTASFFKEETVKISIDKNFGLGIKQLTKELIEN